MGIKLGHFFVNPHRRVEKIEQIHSKLPKDSDVPTFAKSIMPKHIKSYEEANKPLFDKRV